MPAVSAACITGMAWATALGEDIDEVWRQLLAGASGLRDVPSGHALRSRRAAAIGTDRYASLAPARRQQLMAADTIRRALADARLGPADPRLQVVLGTSYGVHLDTAPPGAAGDTGANEDAGASGAVGDWVEEVAAQLGLARPPIVVTTACSSASDSLLTGLELLGAGAGELFLCGGVDVLTEAKRLGHSLLGTMATGDLRAFDVRHDGTLLGEGGGFMVLETAESAQTRGVRILGRLTGAGSANEAAGSAAPDPTGAGLTLAVRRALLGSGAGIEDVAVVSAHGSGTYANDTVEAACYTELFAASAPPPVVFGTKGAFGHTLGATGVLEAITVVKALSSGWAPPVHGLTEADPGFGPRLPTGGPLPVEGSVGLSVTLGFGGFDTCLVFEGDREGDRDRDHGDGDGDGDDPR